MKPAAPPALLAALFFVGCVAPAADLAPAALAPPSALEEVRVLGEFVSEPAIAQHPDGALFVAGYGGEYGGGDVFEELIRPVLYRSDDAGSTWARLEQGGIDARAAGNSDTDLAVAPDGTLYHATMQWMPFGQAIMVGVSKDVGESWSWQPLDIAPFVDRPWIDVGPDNVAHATWSSARGLHHASSADGGATWTEGPLVHPSGGSGGLAVGPRGELAVRVFPQRAPTSLLVTFGFLLVDPDADGIAVSEDGGATWTLREIPGERAYSDQLARGGDGIPRWSDPAAFDASGTLYTAWAEGDALQLGVSRDLGGSWDVRTLHREPDGIAFFPFLRGGAAGELAATWFTWADDELRAHVAHVTAADTAAPVVAGSVVEPASDDTSGEYFQTILLREGGVAAALPVATGDVATSGFAFLARR